MLAATDPKGAIVNTGHAMGHATRLALLCLLPLAGCGRPATPLSDAIDAFRTGDRAALRAARTEADEALRSAVQPNADLCAMTGEDIRKYSEAARIRKFDDPVLLRLPEADRLAYAINVAGPAPRITADSPLRRAPLVRAIEDHDPDALRKCRGARLKLESLAVFETEDGAEGARMTALKGWMADLRRRIGAAQFDARMKDAAARLADRNFTARWPVQTESSSRQRRPVMREAGAR